MPWTPVITPEGLTMLARAVAGEALTFTRAAASGYAYNADGTTTGLNGLHYNFDQPIARMEQSANAINVVVRITRHVSSNPSFNLGFRMDTLSLYARIGTSGNEEIFCVATSDTSVPIPPPDDNASFTLDFAVPIALSNTATVNAVIENSVYATETRLQEAVSALEAKISAVYNKLIDWVTGLLDGANVILAGWFRFSIAPEEWQFYANSQYYYAELSGASQIEFPRALANLPLAVFHFAIGSKKAADDCGIENIVAVNRFLPSNTSATGRVCSIFAYATSLPETTITGTCFVLSPQSVVAPVEEAEEIGEEYTDSVSDITVNGTQVSAVISCAWDGAKAYCALYDSSGESAIDFAQQAVTKGQNTYTFTLGHAFASGNTVTITTMKNYRILATQTYTKAEEELPADP